MRRHRLIILTVIALSACNNAPATTEPIAPSATQIPVQSSTATPTATLAPTATQEAPSDTPTAQPTETSAPTETQRAPSTDRIGDWLVIYEGLRRPHGIGVADAGATLYVSSEIERALIKIVDGVAEAVAPLDFPHDMLITPEGDLITPVFLEDRVVRVLADGSVETIADQLDGPNGIVPDGDGGFFVSNYSSGTVVRIANGEIEIVAEGLNGPAGLAYDAAREKLYIAEYLSNDIVVITPEDRRVVSLPDLTLVESLYFNARGELFATGVLEGAGVIVEVNEDSTYRVFVSTDLPGPLVAHYTPNGLAYVVSPNDPLGRIVRARVSNP